ncbi:hypothetical protein [Streptomyces sp. TR06-5]|uniref:hypothetical protein n=1 Tax=unclassified Streptomyces TaxID=2593676 RepID=UPI0039A27A02
MPSTTTPGESAGSRQDGTGPRRRSVLAGAGLLAVGTAATGCTDGPSPAELRRRKDEADRMRREAARDSEVLLARYAGTLAAHPGLGGRLAPLREAVARHVDVLDPQRGDRGRRRTEAPRMAVPGDEGRALAELASAERRTADARMRALVDAPPELARLLASVAAAGSGHVFLLTRDA